MGTLHMFSISKMCEVLNKQNIFSHEAKHKYLVYLAQLAGGGFELAISITMKIWWNFNFLW